jgi:hypothetical protein
VADVPDGRIRPAGSTIPGYLPPEQLMTAITGPAINFRVQAHEKKEISPRILACWRRMDHWIVRSSDTDDRVAALHGHRLEIDPGASP